MSTSERIVSADHHAGDRSIGQLVADASRDLSTLVRSEIALAKAELKKEAVAGAIGAGLFAGAALFGAIAALFLLIAAAFAIAIAWGNWAGFLIVGVVMLIIAGVLALVGKGRISKVGPPQRTITTSKQSIEAIKGHREAIGHVTR